ncbi:sensor histidine kinase [Tenacibaculum sp. 190524A02b]|uniref:sensor histidine kinase n=1 Tax=Tenacibaculum vairaonense TaxID=3137860 RepID=UPI0031FA7951
MKIKQIYKQIINIGITNELTQKTVKRIKIVNFAAFFMGLNPLIALLVKYFINDLPDKMGLLFLTESIMYFSILFFNHLKKYDIAKSLFIIFFTAILFLHNNFLYKGEYTEYYYLVVPIGTLLFFDSKWVHYTFLVIAILLFFIPNYYLNIYEQGSFGFFHVIPFFLGLFVAVQYFRNENIKNEDKLKKAYVELEDKKKNELAHLQLKSLKAQMNPHFMFNAMNSIQALILKENKHEAYEYLTKFASLIRENLNMSEKSFVYFEEELSLLKKYLELEKLRFQNNFEYKISGIENITDIKIPSMIIQPFIENAIKHGLLHKTDGVKKVTIEFYQEEVLKCIVVDNGIGIQKSKEINTLNNKEASFSTKAIHDRLGLLKDYYKTDIGFTYEKVKQGTKVIIKIPYVNLDD